MMNCCDGHQVSIMICVEGINGFGTQYTAWLSEGEAIELLGTIEEGGCPVCNGLIPFQKNPVN